MATGYPSIVYQAGQMLEANIQNTYYVCTVVSGPDANQYYQVRFSNGAVQPVHLRDLRQNAPPPAAPVPVVASAIPVVAQPINKQPLDATPVAAISTQQYPTPVAAVSQPVAAVSQPVVTATATTPQQRVYPAIPARNPVVVAANPVAVAPKGQVVVAASPVRVQQPVVVKAPQQVVQKAPVKYKTVTTTTKKRVGNKIITTTTTKKIPIVVDPNAPVTVSFNVLCPKNVRPGAFLNVNHNGKPYKVKVPPRHKPGTSFKVTVTTTKR